MREVAFLVPGPLETRTGGFIYDRRMVDALRDGGWPVRVVELDGAFPWPDGEACRRARGTVASLADGTLVVADGLAICAMPEIVEAEAARLRLVVLCHLPIASTMGLTSADAAVLRAREQRALGAAAAVVLTGPGARALLAPYDLPAARVHEAPPGTDPAPLAQGSGAPWVHVLSVATLNAGKGHDVLLHALAALDPQKSPWRLTCAGSCTRDRDTAARVARLVTDLGLADRVSLAGDLDDAALQHLYDRADVFALATRQETYGMAVAEALARGLPVVSTRTGAIPALVGEQAGLLTPVDDTRAFTRALAAVITDEATRARLAAGARARRGMLESWPIAATRFRRILEDVAANG